MICLCVRMLVLKWKERAFIEKVDSRCFCWFPSAILVHQNGTPIWRLHAKVYKGTWNVSANNSETVCHKDLAETWTNCLYISLLWHFVFLASSTGRFPFFVVGEGRGWRQGMGWGFDFFQKFAIKFPAHGQIIPVKCNQISPPQAAHCCQSQGRT